MTGGAVNPLVTMSIPTIIAPPIDGKGKLAVDRGARGRTEEQVRVDSGILEPSDVGLHKILA